MAINLMSGGQGRLRLSPGNFFVASMAGLLPDDFIRSASGEFDFESPAQRQVQAGAQKIKFLCAAFGL